MDNPPLDSPVPLSAEHDVSSFDCGAPALDSYLKKFALQNQGSESARTYVATRGLRVVGYYTLAAASARREETPARVAKGLAAHPVPVILLARLAVARSETGHGLGAGLLKDALLRVVAAADIIGCRAVMVHAKDEHARAFYLRFGFEPSPGDPLCLFLLLKDIKASLGIRSSK
ncbi:MAG: GNAT family N-acetyltransferase [Gemmataceae bacterium]|nr:GNAT family N-acetyltransferase [Gemmataceae bacterium]